MPFNDRLGLQLRVGLDRLSVDQPNAVEEWGWGYWELLWRNYSTIYRERDNHTGEFRPVQNANFLNIGLSPAVSFGSDRLSIRTWAGPTASYFTRVMFQEENWARFYPSIEHTFSYTIRNYAPDKTGWALGVEGGTAASLRMTNWLSVGAGANFRHFLDVDPAAMPLNDILTFDVGFVVHY
jgi:hypothetical protein